VYNVALTGNVASGKSTVAKIWARAGVPLVSADELSREVVQPGTPGLRQVREAFGDEVIDADGALDRERVRGLVFGDDNAREKLEGILHPLIWARRAQWLEEQRAAGEALVVSEIPLLFETDRARDFDATVFVDARDKERLRRLTELRGLGGEEAGRIMAAQMAPEVKRELADHVLTNDGTVDELEAASGQLLQELRAEAGVSRMRLDLHLHTAGSFDCLSDPEAVLETSLARGLDRIAMTDHNRLHVALRMAEAHPGLVIPGEEVKTAEGVDVIGLYLSEEIPKGTPALETIDRIRDQGGIPYLPHPYAVGKGGGGRMADTLAPLCDVVEVFNARLHRPRQNERAGELAVKYGRLRGGGSDAHTLGELGRVGVEVPVHPSGADALRTALASADVTGIASSRLVHLASTWAKVRKKLPGAPTG
jgi:dephospho-CoA kinase